MSIDNPKFGAGHSHSSDYTLSLPDDCLAFILQSSFLSEDDRNNCSLVCRRWLRVEGHTRQRLTLNAHSHLLPSIFLRFDSITELALIGREGLPSIGEKAITRISLECKYLTRLTLHRCKITEDGVEALSETCAGLEELHLNRVRISTPIGSGAAASSLKVIYLEDIYKFDVSFFAPLIKASKSLRTLKLIKLQFPPLDTLLQSIAESVTEIHMENVFVGDSGLCAISSCCPNLEILRLVKFVGDCSNAGIATVANKCRSLRKLHIVDYYMRWKKATLQDEGLMAVAKNCPDLEELVLDGVWVTELSLGMLGANCDKLERLDLCSGKTVGDDELDCIAANCNALKKLWIEYCPVSDRSIQALASGGPHLVEVMFRECEALSLEGVCRLRASKASLVVDFDKVGRGRSKEPRYVQAYRELRDNLDNYTGISSHGIYTYLGGYY